MVVKVYISGISGNKEVKKRQQRVLMILDSKNIKYEIIDITEPGKEDDKDFMQNNSKSNGGTVSDPNPRTPLPPQVFNDDEYCGDYDQFDLANEVDTLEQFLKVEAPPEESPLEDRANALNGDVQTNEEGQDFKENLQNTENIVATVENITDTKEAPIDDSNDVGAKENSEKEPTVDKDMSPLSQKSDDKDEATEEKADKPTDETDIESKQISKENTPAPGEVVNENGAVGSREQSEEKEQVNEQKTDNPSEALIQSEQAASTD